MVVSWMMVFSLDGFLDDFRVLHLDRVSASWLFVGRVEHGAVAATSKYGFHVELVRATGFLSCVDAVEQFFFFFKNLTYLTVALQRGQTF